MTSIIPIPNLPQTTSVNLFDVVVGVQSGTTVKIPISQIAAATTAGVSSFNTRTGAVTLTAGDITGAGGAPIASPTFTGTVTIPGGASIAGYAPIASPTFTGTVTIPGGASITGYETTATANATFLPFTGGTLTGALTPDSVAGIVGTTTNNNTSAGSIGEYMTATQGSTLPMTTNVALNITSLSLTAGDWDVYANAVIEPTAGATMVIAAISTTSGGFSAPDFRGTISETWGTPNSTIWNQSTGAARVLLATTTTVFLVAKAVFGSGTCGGAGSIQARRVR